MNPLYEDKMVMYVDVELVFRARMRGTKDTYGIRQLYRHLESRTRDRLPLLYGSRDSLLYRATIRQFMYIPVHLSERKEI